MKRESIVLCCGGRGCPVVTAVGDENPEVIITDDFGGKVTLKNEEAKLLIDALKKLC